MKLSGFLITIYFEKAFDSVNHNFLNITLKAFKYRSILCQMGFQSKFYLCNGYIFESRFLVGTISPISLIFGVVKEKCSNLKKMLFIF